jgi:hypothetical protein
VSGEPAEVDPARSPAMVIHSTSASALSEDSRTSNEPLHWALRVRVTFPSNVKDELPQAARDEE